MAVLKWLPPQSRGLRKDLEEKNAENAEIGLQIADYARYIAKYTSANSMARVGAVEWISASAKPATGPWKMAEVSMKLISKRIAADTAKSIENAMGAPGADVYLFMIHLL